MQAGLVLGAMFLKGYRIKMQSNYLFTFMVVS